MPNQSLEKKHTVSYKLLVAILFIALLVRLYWVITQAAVIENEGGEYARIAENLLKGNGYVGTTEGPQLLFPPLYPILIAIFSLVTGDSEVAGRLVSLVIGTSLILPIFFISLHIYGRKVAFIAASLVAFHPLLISLSAAVYSEPTFMTLTMAGVYWGLRAIELKSLKHSILSGICFGLTYLTRPEAVIYPFLTTLMIFIVTLINKEKLRKAAFTSLGLLIPFVLLAIPYIAFLSFQIGQIRFEGKSNIHYTISRRESSGMSYLEAAFGIDENLREEGPLLNPNLFVSHSVYNISPRELARSFYMNAKHNIKTLRKIVFRSKSFGSPILIGLVLVGVFRKAWSYKRIIQEGFILIIVSSMVLTVLSAHDLWFRYTFPFLPFLILWASKGIEELAIWSHSTAKSIKFNFLLSSKHIGICVRWALSIIFILFSIRGIILEGPSEFEQAKSIYAPVKKAGLWLDKYMPGPKKIMSTGTVVPYYSKGRWLPFPYADSTLSLKYIHLKHPDFIILIGSNLHTPYLQEWIKNGIPDENAHLIYDRGNTIEEKILIYQWDSQHVNRRAKMLF